jgi:hypothetical protein
VLALAALPGIHPALEGSTGLVSVAGPWYLAGVVAMATGFALGLWRGDGPGWLPGVELVAMVVLVSGLGVLVEPLPRLAVTYTHLGFARYVANQGTSLPPIDARAGWPGAFSLIAALMAIVHDPTGFTIGRWAPVAFDLMAVAPLLVLFTVVTEDVRARWLALWVFFTANWVEQDYLSPQAVDFTLYLAVLGLLVAVFGPGRRLGRWPGDAGSPPASALRSRLGAWRARLVGWSPATPAGAGYPPAVRAALLGLVVLIAAAATVAHQLTPYVLVIDVALLALAGRCRLGTLPWLLALMALGWLSFGASSFWTGHLPLLTGSAGNVAGNVSTGVSHRIRGDVGHLVVLGCRVGLVVAVAAAAAVGALRWRRRRLGQPWVVVMALAPALLIGVQSYGGEVVIRTFLFALPFLAAMAAAAVFPGRRRAAVPGAPSRRRGGRFAARPGPGAALLAAGLSVLSLVGLVAHYGADQYEGVSASEMAAVRWFYAHVPSGASVFTVCVNLPWRYQGAAAYHYQALVADNYGHPLAELDRLVSPRYGAYFIASQSQAVCGEQLLGLPDHWLTTLEAGLEGTGHVALVYDRAGARIYHIVPHQPAAPRGGIP